MRQGSARNGDIELFWLAEGPADAPAVVLVNGAGSTAVMWCRELIDPLLEAGYQVVRFDNRDIGRSTRIAADQTYLIADLADDLAAVLDHLELERAHLLGRSMGGMTAMALAASQPARVASLVLVYTTPCLADPAHHGLPGPQAWVLEAMAEEAFSPPPSTEAERVARRIAETRLYAGTRYDFDDAWARAEATADAAHAPFAETGHGAAVTASPSLAPELARINQPTLVLHGTADPIIDVEHGRFLAAALPNAELIEYEGLGHEMPPAFCAEIIDPLLALLSR